MIVVFGSINVDMVLAVPTLPRPGETVLAPGYALVPGGKGANQALAAARAGASVAMFGCVGRDPFAETALAGLRAAGVGLDGVDATETATGCAAVCVDAAGENQIAVASGANLLARADRVPDDMLSGGTTLLLQLEVGRDETRSLAERARARGARVILNAAPAAALSAEFLAMLDVLVVNAIEAAMLAAAVGIAGDDPVAAIQGLARRFGCAAVVTLGAAGAAACVAGETWRIGALGVDTIDTTGAGDAFTGVLAAALDGGAALPDALRPASVAAALACLAEGAQAALPGAAEIEARSGGLQAAVRVAETVRERGSL